MVLFGSGLGNMAPSRAGLGFRLSWGLWRGA